eukprot:Gb_08615 [translate_table: standard]
MSKEIDMVVAGTATSDPGNAAKEEVEKNKKSKAKKEEAKNNVPFHKLFAFADSLDTFLMIMGTFGSVANGLSFPVITLLFGQLTDAFGKNSDIHKMVCLRFVYVGVGAGTASFFRERQAARIRSLYLKAILRQDVAFFDNDTSTGEVIGRMSGDTILIQDALGEKLQKLKGITSKFCHIGLCYYPSPEYITVDESLGVPRDNGIPLILLIDTPKEILQQSWAGEKLNWSQLHMMCHNLPNPDIFAASVCLAHRADAVGRNEAYSGRKVRDQWPQLPHKCT